MTKDDARERIAELNDLARTAMGVASRVFITDGIRALPESDQSRIRERVETFDDFPPGDDPYGERDFGAINYDGQKFFWKIDYYNNALDRGSKDPADPKITIRVLTIMLANEY